ncbi:protein TPX2-like [Bidens hawaiensis]|uniref:protein TPX2-like n=1 Tax=Bidens hawaiensis TaxID=980011 RepID=UPI0040490C01
MHLSVTQFEPMISQQNSIMEVEMEDDYHYDYSNGNPAVAFTFTAIAIDVDYEFDAARFFDFTRDETRDEASQAEAWFDSAESYPPSPFAVGLISREQSENASCSTSSKAPHTAPESSSMAFGNTDGDVANDGVLLNLKNYSVAFQNQQSTSTVLKENIINAYNKYKTKSTWKPSFPRTSTLMKPTVSQLAKQNHERLIDNFRFQNSGNNSSVVEGQAAKRQKVEGGHFYKATGTDQQANFIHKAPKREGNVDGNLGRGRLRLTVPRSPDLATAQRAQRIRKNDNSGTEHVSTRAPGFRARPLNRKIFEAPSFLLQKRSIPQLPEFHEFHLKTSERAAQNTAAGPSTSACCDNNSKAPLQPSFAFGVESSSRESKGPHVIGASIKEDCQTLNKKKISTKGDFRTSKRETTVAMVFNFQTETRAHHVPPVDLFNNLSLASESGSQANKPRLARAPSIFSKVSKENRVQNLDKNRIVSTVKK